MRSIARARHSAAQLRLCGMFAIWRRHSRIAQHIASSYLSRQKNKPYQDRHHLFCRHGKAVRPRAGGGGRPTYAVCSRGASVALSLSQPVTVGRKRRNSPGAGKAPGGYMCPCQRCDRFLQPGQMRNDPDSLSHFCFFLSPPHRRRSLLVNRPSSMLPV